MSPPQNNVPENQDGNDPFLDPVLLRGLTASRFSRREAVRRAGIGLGALSAGSLLAACGVGGSTSTTSTPSEVAAFWEKQEKTGSFTFANWPLYIDTDPNNKNVHPSLEIFTKQTGIEVSYKEVIQDYDPFFAKIQPDLAAGRNPGYDLANENEKYVHKMIEAGWLIPLDHSRLTNFEKYAADKYKHQPVDPGNKYVVPYQSGFIGIGYDPNLTGREITSFKDLLDPQFKGKVGMYGDALELGNFTLVGIGIKPEGSTVSDWEKAAAVLQKQKDDGIVRQYYTQDYIQALSHGDVWMAMAYSGDIFQANLSGSNLRFVIPDEGGIVWTDNNFILAHSEHALDAMIYMDFIFKPEIAAMMAEGIDYISPVPSAKAIVQQDLAKATGAEKKNLQEILSGGLVFPSAETYSRTYERRILSDAEEKKWNSIFEPIYQS
jgi:spermidine/putrescine transport system substrate-binding protein